MSSFWPHAGAGQIEPLGYTETMTLAIDDALLPATLAPYPMTDEEFAAFCAEHPDLNFEMTAEGELVVMAPTHFSTGNRNAQINRQLGNWTESDGGGMVGESSTGFVLPNVLINFLCRKFFIFQK